VIVADVLLLRARSTPLDFHGPAECLGDGGDCEGMVVLPLEWEAGAALCGLVFFAGASLCFLLSLTLGATPPYFTCYI
jgi:hypothetical protein